MSEVKVNKITPTADCGTVTLGDSGDTVAIPAGVTLTSGGALQNSGTITNTGSITGVAITGTIDNQVNWQTTVKTTGFTATAGEGYFCNTTSGAFTVTLPASPSAGDLVGIKDYANTADTNNITIGRNGSNIEGVANDFLITVEGGSITLIYVDATKGWLSTAAAKASDISESATFITATGGTVVTCGNFKTHIFTGPGTFCVSAVGNPAGGPNAVDYLVVAGGGSAGGGAGGFRMSNVHSLPGPTTSPLANPTGITVTATAFPITVGAGATSASSKGSNTIFSTITSAGGGSGGNPGCVSNTPGGSGAGEQEYGPNPFAAGTGNTPPVSPPQGNNGGTIADPTGSIPPSGSSIAKGAGGGAGAAGAAVTLDSNGNTSPTSSISGGVGSFIDDGFVGPTAPSYGTPGPVGSTRYFAGGGAGFSQIGAAARSCGVGGSGGGAPSAQPTSANATTNTGGGGASQYNDNDGNGGSGIVMIRYKYQ